MTAFQKLIGISALIASLSLAYYFIYLPTTKEQSESIESNSKPWTAEGCRMFTLIANELDNNPIATNSAEFQKQVEDCIKENVK